MSIIYNPRQVGNPLLKCIPDTRLMQGDKIMKPDYLIGDKCGVLFLSLKYHSLHPEYIYKRIDSLGSQLNIKILLIFADVENSPQPLTAINKLCLMRDLTLVVSWSLQEAGTYLASLGRRIKATTDKNNPVQIQKKGGSTYDEQLNEVLTQIPRINKADVNGLSMRFKSFKNIVANAGLVEQLTGWGPTKSSKFKAAISQPFSSQNPM